MKHWELLDTAKVPEGEEELSLYRRDTEYSIRAGYIELMNSRVHNSEDVLATLAIEKMPNKMAPILVGGLGMGYTLRAALNALPKGARVTVAELVPTVIRWNQEFLGHLADNPLGDTRVKLYEGDVKDVLKENSFGAILYDVDNGPEGLTREQNSGLYGRRGITRVYDALIKEGVFAVWSTARNDSFTDRLKKCGFTVELIKTRERVNKGSVHYIWVAQK